MIARMWRGWAPAERADVYQGHDESDVATELRGVPGFVGARLLRREDGEEVGFTSITFFTDLDAVRAFAGDDLERAVVTGAALTALSRWDERVTHHEVSAVIG
jgi:heme-degrading monooxygenase HmoA